MLYIFRKRPCFTVRLFDISQSNVRHDGSNDNIFDRCLTLNLNTYLLVKSEHAALLFKVVPVSGMRFVLLRVFVLLLVLVPSLALATVCVAR